MVENDDDMLTLKFEYGVNYFSMIVFLFSFNVFSVFATALRFCDFFRFSFILKTCTEFCYYLVYWICFFISNLKIMNIINTKEKLNK